MSTKYSDYPSEKAPLILLAEELPGPAVAAPATRKRHSRFGRVLKFIGVFFAIIFISKAFARGIRMHRGCGHGRQGIFDGHQHAFPPMDDWEPYAGTTHFEFQPTEASGLTIKGSRTFGKVVFETSKLSDKVVVDLEIKTNKEYEHNEVTVEEGNGFITIHTPDHGKLKTYTSAKIQIPSDIVGTFGLPAYEVNVPQHMVDLSALPESLEIGDLVVRIASGFIKSGLVHTNTTDLSVASGAIEGRLTHARETTGISVGSGHITVDTRGTSSGNQGISKVHIGHGDLRGSFSVYNGTFIDVANGSIDIAVHLEEGETRAELKTEIAAGNSNVAVASVAPERTFHAVHTSVNGNQAISYPSNFQGTVDARTLIGHVEMMGKDLVVERVAGGVIGKQGDSERNAVNIKGVHGSIEVVIADK